jgi:hypothetical protein
VSIAALAAPARPAAAASDSERKTEVAVLKLINDARAHAGLHRLVENASVIRGLTERHSRWLADNRYGENARIDPHRGFSDRYEKIRAHDSGAGGVCENVAFVNGYKQYKKVAKTFYRLWDESKHGHHECMLDKSMGDGIRALHTSVGAVGIERRGRSWYATFIAAEDSSPGK